MGLLLIRSFGRPSVTAAIAAVFVVDLGLTWVHRRDCLLSDLAWPDTAQHDMGVFYLQLTTARTLSRLARLRLALLHCAGARALSGAETCSSTPPPRPSSLQFGFALRTSGLEGLWALQSAPVRPSLTPWIST